MEINNSHNFAFTNSHGIIKQEEKTHTDNAVQTSPAFKGGIDYFLNKSGWAMNGIEKGGFLVLFLIQDFLGMTVPRTIAGFLRDREVTGNYNFQEGFEVLGREGLTGPCMMAVAPLTLYLMSKPMGQSISINSELIKRYGDSLKAIVSSPDFDKSLLKDGSKFKHEFYKKNIDSILRQTLGESFKGEQAEKDIKASVEYIMKQLENYEHIPKDAELKFFMGKSRYRAECLDNIAADIDNLKYKSSTDLDMLQKVKFGVEGYKEPKIFETNKAFEGLVKYSNDAIKFNKNLDKLDSAAVESLKHSALGKRILINAGMIAATLGMLSVLPKLYLRGATSPGSRKKYQIEENQNIENQNNENLTFRGKNSSIIEKLGKAVDKNKKDFVSSELEYNGHNFTNTLMAGLSLFGLITPRCMRAYSRADVDEKTGKKDLTELWEIIVRDITSSLAVVFVVPMLTRTLVTSYEKNSGYVLMHKDRTKSGLKTALGLLNPYSKAHVLTNSEIGALYDNINSKEKMLNFCKYIDKNGGDLQKILSKTDDVSEIFNENTKTIEELKKLSKGNSNKEIINIVENIEEKVKKSGKSIDKKSIDEMFAKLMKHASKGGNSKITAVARGLVSLPGLLTTLFISPYILGWAIPRLTYKNTRRIHAKEDRERAMQEAQEQQKLKVAV